MKWHRKAISLIKGWCPKIKKRRNLLFFNLDRFHKTEGTNFFLIGLVFSLILIAGTYLLAKRAEEIGPFYFTLRLSEGHYDPERGLYIIRSPEYYLDIGIYQESIEVKAPSNARVLISAYWTSGPGFAKWDWHGGLLYIFENGSFISPRGPGLEPDVYRTNNMTYNITVHFGSWNYWEIWSNSPEVTVKIAIRLIRLKASPI